MNKMDEKEQEFKRKALGVIDSAKEMQLMQGLLKPDRTVLSMPITWPDVMRSFCKCCGGYGEITSRGVMLLEILLELRQREDEILEDIDGYFVEMETCPVCNPENASMEFRFRRVSEVED